MKKIIIAIIFSFSLCSFGQVYYRYELKNGLKIYNGGITVVSDSLGITFIGENGKKYHQYFREIEKIDNGLIYICHRRGRGDNYNLICVDLEIIPFIKIVSEIEGYNNNCSVNSHYYGNYHGSDDSDSWGFISKFGKIKYFPACKNGKYARISKYGEILTDFKYDDWTCSSYTELDENNNPQKNYVILDEKGTEILKSKEFIHKFWDENNYITEDLETKTLYLTYKNKKHKIDNDFKEHLNEFDLPYQSDIFINGKNINQVCDDENIGYEYYYCGERWFYKLDKGKIKSKRKNFRPESRFYKNHCIVSEKNGDKRSYHIMNNKFKIVKSLPNDYPIVEVTNFNEQGLSVIEVFATKEDDEFYYEYKRGLIDYKGNIIIPIEYKVLYEVGDLYFTKKYDENDRYLQDESGYFNQNGERIEKD